MTMDRLHDIMWPHWEIRTAQRQQLHIAACLGADVTLCAFLEYDVRVPSQTLAFNGEGGSTGGRVRRLRHGWTAARDM